MSTRLCSLWFGFSCFFHPGWWQVGHWEEVMPGPSSVGSTQALCKAWTQLTQELPIHVSKDWPFHDSSLLAEVVAASAEDVGIVEELMAATDRNISASFGNPKPLQIALLQ